MGEGIEAEQDYRAAGEDGDKKETMFHLLHIMQGGSGFVLAPLYDPDTRKDRDPK